MDYLDSFSQFAAAITYETLGSDIHEQVGWILADTLGAIVAGSAEPELRALAERQAPGPVQFWWDLVGVPAPRQQPSSTAPPALFWKWTRATGFPAGTRRFM